MTPAQFLSRIQKGAVPPAILLLGPEAYERRRILDALAAGFPEGSIAQHDLTELSLAEVVDDARSLSLVRLRTPDPGGQRRGRPAERQGPMKTPKASPPPPVPAR